ncbi:S-layer homology domain-containing protein [Cohnella thermotolerans]|uniref:S-layer homology domain-containing protein n=1 Tax=Cohnella thermotolerans TaxID=329858 RepID=UPI0004162A89|nr:S-layer homology domain-containing protein [Cohnella thermotolerans]
MHRIKRTLVWLMVAVLLGSVFPAQFAQRAAAATSATYFLPDNLTLRGTAALVTDNTSGGTLIDRTNVYIANTGKLTIDGTFNYVSGSSMSVTVEQLTASTNSAGNPIWVTDSTHVITGPVSQVSGTTNRFSASNLTLFSGFNKITFTGTQGNVQRSDTFYVLYDSVPYIENIKVLGSSAGSLPLNENTQVVVDSKDVALTGSVQNATKVSVSLNGGTAILSSLSENIFYTPTLSLQSGVNTVLLTISNGSDSINVSRVLYYFDKNQPFTKIDINQTGGSTYPLLNNIPSLSDSGTSGSFQIQILIPYSADPNGKSFANNGTLKVEPISATTNRPGRLVTDVPEDTIIPGPDGVTPAYRLVTFNSPSAELYNFIPAGSPDSTQRLRLTVTYGSFAATYDAKFNYLPGKIVINNMYYLPDYNGSGSADNVTRENLNGATVPQAEFYIMVETDKDISDPTQLQGFYLPLSTSTVNLQPVSGATTDTKKAVYKVTGFSSGIQQVKFVYNGSASDAGYTVTITYASKSYIYLKNIYDGMTYTFNSKNGASSLAIEGKYIGFDKLYSGGTQFFLNGTERTNLFGTQLTPVPGQDTYDFTFTLPISATGDYMYPGENTLVFKGVNTDSAGNKTEITKTVRIYVVDENIPNIGSFIPTGVPSNNIREDIISDPVASGYSSDKLAKIFWLSTDFTKKDGTTYETSKKKYDLVLSGSGALYLNLYKGSDTFFTATLPDDNKATTGQTTSGYAYELVGNQDFFILRIKDIAFEDNSLQDIYNLELVNTAGARASQKLEIDRVLTSYRIIAPQPTVGNDIIVNKNFVHFDIEAEGATQVLIGKDAATPRRDIADRFEYDYVGLKANKNNAIKIQIVRPSGTINDTINVYYTDSIQIDTQFMETMSAKHSIFNKALQLTFPKGTVLKSAQQNSNGVTKYYPDTKLLFGIADPKDGVVGRRNDYGNIINQPQTQTDEGRDIVKIPEYLTIKFLSNTYTSNFTRVSQIYWISGGEGEYLDKGATGYEANTDGLPPYSSEGNFTEFKLERKVVPSNRGTLTLAFDPNVVADAGTTLTVFRYTNSGVWENIGGVVDTKNHTISVPFDEFGYYKVMKLSKSFADITNHGWARNILNALYAKGIMPDTGAGTFGADDVATRGEFATLLVKGLNIPLNYDDKNTFYDVVPSAVSGAWSYKYIETAARAGIINGLTEGFFNPDGKLSREEAAVMIARALQLTLPTNDSKLDASLGKSFLDSASISYYAKPAVSAVSKAKIMNGAAVTVTGSTKTFYNFNPKSYLTRAEAGKIAVALLQKSTKLFPSNLS